VPMISGSRGLIRHMLPRGTALRLVMVILGDPGLGSSAYSYILHTLLVAAFISG
jgi:hypothetical protein